MQWNKSETRRQTAAVKIRRFTVLVWDDARQQKNNLKKQQKIKSTREKRFYNEIKNNNIWPLHFKQKCATATATYNMCIDFNSPYFRHIENGNGNGNRKC